MLVYVPALWILLEAWRFLALHLLPIGIRPVLVLGRGEDARRAASALEAGDITGHRLLLWKEDLSFLRPAGDAEGALISRKGSTPSSRRTARWTSSSRRRSPQIG